MQWLTQTAPLEFAGHVMFTARKRRQTANSKPQTVDGKKEVVALASDY